MKCVVAYESMYGNTRAIAAAIAEGIRTVAAADLRHIARVGDLNGIDLLVLGAPTHVRGLPRTSTRRSAAETIAKRGTNLQLEPDSRGAGVREWLAQARVERHRDGGISGLRVAAFDTHYATPANLGGSAAKPIARRLRRAGGVLVDRPTGFRVVKGDVLAPGELERARAWGERLARHVSTQPPRATDAGGLTRKGSA